MKFVRHNVTGAVGRAVVEYTDGADVVLHWHGPAESVFWASKYIAEAAEAEHKVYEKRTGHLK